MIVVVEGIDRVGKTTLIAKLVKELGFKKLEFIEKYDKVNNPNHELTKIVETEKIYATISCLKTFNELGANIVLDRFHLSELVYGNIERGYINDEMWEVDNLLAEMGVKLIYVVPTDLTFSSLKHGSDLAKHYFNFKLAVSLSQLETFYCNYATLDNAVEFIRREME